MNRTVVIVCIVSRLITNYPRIIAVCGDDLDVGTYPNPSSSYDERSGSRVACVIRSLSIRALCIRRDLQGYRMSVCLCVCVCVCARVWGGVGVCM